MEFDNLVIVHHGEVYNFREIRQELEKKEYTFSDTEVIFKAFHRWGLDCVTSLGVCLLYGMKKTKG